MFDCHNALLMTATTHKRLGYVCLRVPLRVEYTSNSRWGGGQWQYAVKQVEQGYSFFIFIPISSGRLTLSL